MPTIPLTITSSWVKAADGPISVVIPAIARFQFCTTTGGLPSLAPAVCPSREGGEELSISLLAGQSLYVAADQEFMTSLTTGVANSPFDGGGGGGVSPELAAVMVPNPPIPEEPFFVTFSAVPDSITSSVPLAGAGRTRNSVAPATGSVSIHAELAGSLPLDLIVDVAQAEFPPTATGGSIELVDRNLVFIPPLPTGGVPDPDVTLTAATLNGLSILAQVVDDTYPDPVKSTESTYAASWLVYNGVGPGVTITAQLVVPAPAISAVSTPTGSRTYAGQTPADIAGIATATDPANYTTTVGTIALAQLQVNEENATTGTPLATSDEVSVLVTTSTGLTRRFPLSVTEYAYEIIDQGPAGFDLRINDLMPGSLNQTIGALGDTTTTTLDALNVGPVSHIAPVIALKGETFEDTGADRWLTERSAGTVSYARQWLRNGAPIAGATGPTYTRGTADGGTTTTLRKTATNGNGTGPAAVSNGIANAGSVAVVSKTNLLQQSNLKGADSNVAHAMGNATIPASGTGQIVVRGGLFRLSNSIPDLASVTIGGTVVPIRVEGTDSRAIHFLASIPRASLPTGAQPVVVNVEAASGSVACIVSVDWLPNADVPGAAVGKLKFNGLAQTSNDISADTTPNGIVMGVTVERTVSTTSTPTNPGVIDWTGIIEGYSLVVEAPITGGTERFKLETASALTTLTETPRAMSVSGYAGSRGGVAAIFFPAGA